MTEATVTVWFKQLGDRVELDEPLCEVSTDKVDTEIPSPSAGVLHAIVVPAGDTAPVGSVIAHIVAVSDATADAPLTPTDGEPEPAQPSAPNTDSTIAPAVAPTSAATQPALDNADRQTLPSVPAAPSADPASTVSPAETSPKPTVTSPAPLAPASFDVPPVASPTTKDAPACESLTRGVYVGRVQVILGEVENRSDLAVQRLVAIAAVRAADRIWRRSTVGVVAATPHGSLVVRCDDLADLRVAAADSRLANLAQIPQMPEPADLVAPDVALWLAPLAEAHANLGAMCSATVGIPMLTALAANDGVRTALTVGVSIVGRDPETVTRLAERLREEFTLVAREHNA